MVRVGRVGINHVRPIMTLTLTLTLISNSIYSLTPFRDKPLSHPAQALIVSNVVARVLIFVDLRRMSQLACSFLMPMQIPWEVSARVLVSADLCRMYQLACHFSC